MSKLRVLTDQELLLVSGGDNTIVVVGQVPDTSIYSNFVLSSFNSSTYMTAGGSHSGPTSPISSQTMTMAHPHATTVMVNVSVSDSSHMAAAMAAAENVARGLTRIESGLMSVASNTPINWDGATTTAGNALSIIQNTQFIVDDNSTYNNGGVGSSAIGTNGQPNVDHLNYQAFQGNGSYADPGYQNDAGLVGILLHETGHLTPQGDSFRTGEINYYAKEYHTTSGFANFNNGPHSDYAINSEMNSNDFSAAAASAAGLSLSGYNPTFGYGAEAGWQVYGDHYDRGAA